MQSRKKLNIIQYFAFVLITLLSYSSFAQNNEPTASAHIYLTSQHNQTTNDSNIHNIVFDHVESAMGFELDDSKTKILVKEAGVFYLTLIGQAGSSDEKSLMLGGSVNLWITKNDKPISNSNAIRAIGINNKTGILVSQAIVQLNPGDTIGAAYSSTEPKENLGLIYTPANPNMPASPSVNFGVSKL